MLNKFAVLFISTCLFIYAEEYDKNPCKSGDIYCFFSLIDSNRYDKVCKDAKDEFRCVIELLPAQGLVGSQYFEDVYREAADKADPCVNEKTTAAFFESLALMRTTGYYLDGELAESVPFIVGDLCLNSMQCLESAFKSANLGARNIIMEEVEYQIDYDVENSAELIKCRNKIRAFLKANKIEFNSTTINYDAFDE
jgi:hypothetical protein